MPRESLYSAYRLTHALSMPRAIRRIAALLSAAALIHAVAAPGIAGAPAAMATVSGAESGECDGAGLHADRADHSAPVPGGKQGSRQAPCDGCEVDCLTMAGCTSPALAMAWPDTRGASS